MAHWAVAIALALSVAALDVLPTYAAESLGECYVLDPSASSADGAQTESWQGPTQANIGACAALAGAEIDNANDGLGKARWQGLDVVANDDGSYQTFKDGQPHTSGFWKVEVLVESNVDDIDQFWRREFEAREWTYSSPNRVQSYDTRIRTACGRAVPDNAFYCRSSHSIYYSINLLTEEFTDIGDAAPIVIVAHEWGHAIQSLRGALRRSQSVSQLELQADCFSGAYVRDATSRGLFDDSDAQEARDMYAELRASRNHGTPKQRLASFENGFTGGVDACIA